MKVAVPLTTANSYFQVPSIIEGTLVMQIILPVLKFLFGVMSEQLCLQWNDFKENVNSAFGSLRNDKEFTDVTLACEDGQQMEAHKVILAASSPFFEKILQKNKHPHPVIYLKGFQSKDFVSILDFLYFGEANVFQEDLDSFLAIAEEIQLKGLIGHTWEPVHESNDFFQNSTSLQADREPKESVPKQTSSVVAIQSQSSIDLQALDEKVKSMMEKGQKMITVGKQGNGMPKQVTSRA